MEDWALYGLTSIVCSALVTLQTEPEVWEIPSVLEGVEDGSCGDEGLQGCLDYHHPVR